MKAVKLIQVFISSTNEMIGERDICYDAIAQVNSLVGYAQGFRLEGISWDRNTSPELGARPQEVINQQIAQDYDIYVGLLCSKFGTPTGKFGSGTEEEFELAYLRKNQNENIELLMYFKDARQASEEINFEQALKVQSFRSRIEPLGLIHPYSDVEQFRVDIVRHLNDAVSRLNKDIGVADTDRTGDGGPHAAGDYVGTAPIPLEDLGILELQESYQDKMADVSELMTKVANFQRIIGEKIVQSTLEVRNSRERSINGVVDTNEAKLIINGSAFDLSSFASKLGGTIPLLAQNFYGAMQDFSTIIVIMQEDGMDSSDDSIRDAERMTESLIETIEGVLPQMKGFRTAVEGLPRMTSEFNRAKRSAAKSLSELEEFMNKSLALLRKNVSLLDGYRNSQVIN